MFTRCNTRIFPATSGVCAFVLALGLAGMAARAAPGEAERETITNLHDLRRAVETTKHWLCDLDLEAVVCAADSVTGVLALQDATGTEVCRMELNGRVFFPGERIRIRTSRCELIRRKSHVVIAPAPVVDNRGIHSVGEASGRIRLPAGTHLIRLFYFNALEPAVLEVSYEGPGIPLQPIPPVALFLEPSDAGSRSNERTNGLRYFCYEDTPSTLDDLRNMEPVGSGEVSTFSIDVRQPREYVAMQFRGLIEIPESGVYTFSTLSDDGSELYIGGLDATIEVLSSNAPPTARVPNPGATVPESTTGAWATAEGRVKFLGKGPGGLEVVLQDGNNSMLLWLASNEDVLEPLLLNAQLRATGVCQSVTGLDGDRHLGRISVVNASDLQVLGIAAEQWDRYPISSIAHLQAAGPGAGAAVAHLRGKVSGWGAGGGFVLNDRSGTLPVQSLDLEGIAPGLGVEVLGGVVDTAGGLEVRPAFFRLVEASPSSLPVLNTAAQVQQLSTSEAARQYPVRVRGVVTCLIEWGGAVVQDSTRGVFLHLQGTHQEGLEPGDFAEIEGVTGVGDFAPIVTAESVRVLGRGPVPEPVQPNWKQLMSGSLDSQYAELRGIITAVEGNKVTLLTDGGKLIVQVHDIGELALKRLLNTLVRIRGCLLAEWDAQTRQVKVGEVRIRNPTIEMDRLPRADPFSAPARTIANLLLFDLHASGFQRVKVSGQVVHLRGGEYFLMQDGRGLRFRPVDGTDLRAGDQVDVVGIPELSGASPQLHEAVARKTGVAPLPSPVRWPDAENPGMHWDSIRVETEARLIGLNRAGAEWVLELQTGLRAYRAVINTSRNLAAEFPLDSLLGISGVYAALNGERNADLSSFELLLNSKADIRLIKRPPWWNLRRLLFIVASLIIVLTAAAAWITQLRRKVGQRTVLLEREHSRREHAERQRAVEFERSRIARDLHDDLGSSLTEIRVLASTGVRLTNPDSRSPSLFKAITAKARSLIGALDVIVWAVDPEENSLQSLADYLSGYAAEYLAASNIVCRFKIPVSLPAATLDGRVRHDLFLAVKETLHNVVQHSGASEVEFQLVAAKDSVEIVIIDNGCGYHLDAATTEGHGLKNLSERLESIGGHCRMESKPGQGTAVRIHLPMTIVKAGGAG